MTEPKVMAYTLFPSCKGDERRYDVVEEHLTAKGQLTLDVVYQVFLSVESNCTLQGEEE